MRNRLGALALTAALLLPSASVAADADALADASITIRTYDITGLATADRQAALAVAAEILRAAGLTVEWMPCEAVFTRTATDPCLAPLGGNELVIRFVHLPAPPGHQGTLSLGNSLVDTRRRAGALATIYVDRVAGLALHCNVDLGTLLGRAAAHEVGHLLLGTREHAQSGLMRALWSREALRGTDAAKWLFTPRDSRTMREAVRTRAAQELALHMGTN